MRRDNFDDKTEQVGHIPQGRRFEDFPAQKNQMYDQQLFQQVPSAHRRVKKYWLVVKQISQEINTQKTIKTKSY